MYTYKGPTPVKKGTKVKVDIDLEPKEATVIWPLSAQFTAQVGNVVRFYLYTHKGITWELSDEDV